MVAYVVMGCVSSVLNTYWFYKIIMKGVRMLKGTDGKNEDSDEKNKSDELANGKLNAVTTKNVRAKKVQ
jgi:hypothetical protein